MEEKQIELAEHYVEQEREAAMSRTRAALAVTHPDFDGKHCIDCDDAIPPKRLAVMRCVRCATCQEIFERKSKLGLVH